MFSKNFKIFLLSFCFFGFFSSASLKAYEDIPACFKDLELNFFTRKDVFQALDMYPLMVYTSTWDAIYQEIKYQSASIPDRVRTEAKLLNPNPLQHPFDPKKSLDILKVVLFTTFKEAVLKYTVERFDGAMETMFDYLLEQNEYQWQLCLRSKKR